MPDADLNRLREYFSGDIWLLDVFGRTVETPNFQFIPCAAEFPLGKHGFKSADIDLAGCPRIMSCVVEDGESFDHEEATFLWLRGRIAAIFGIQPPFSQGLYDIFQLAFAVVHTQNYPVRLNMMAVTGGNIGDYGGCELDFAFHFDAHVESNVRKLAIAELLAELLRKPDDIKEYFDYVSDGCDVTMIEFNRTAARFTLKSGSMISGDFDDELDPHLGWGYFSTRECPDCNGLGEEYTIYPMRQTCEHCNGDGRVHW